jgi:hypothetical protein
MKKLIAICVVALIVSTAGANLVEITNDPCDTGQDLLTISGLVDELGNNFPDDELIASSEYIATYRPCLENPDDLEIPNIAVSITNLTTKSWWDLHYVADPETMLQNYDKNRLNGQLAFKIDYTGNNAPLMSESIAPDLVFQPGETWVFVIQDYTNGKGLPASAFGSLGVGSGSTGDTISSGSIIAIPEPATICILGLGALSLVRRKK